ncbi:MAG TPA: D-glycero-beta-D-manno-heptose-7-phosphate kinase [Vicinamibacterales bacterium]|jgi:D-beta-D-heptose 7-phosphate kinase/D-beta-D-heptose 1-phosphate adenosyltransferase
MLSDLLGRLSGRSVLVIGDLMIDQFVIGTVDRISPEAPVPIVRFDHETWRLGGAANVAHNIVSLGGGVQTIGVVGNDADGARLLEELSRRSIGTAGIVGDSTRCTTRKVRVVTTRNQQVARIDYEHDAEIAADVESTVVQKIGDLAANAQAIVISDYLKGAISSKVASAAVDAAHRHGIPLLVDPKVPHVGYYAGATVITPNHHEAEAVTHMRIRSGRDAREAARRFRERARCESVLITRGEHGMCLLGPDGERELAAEAREVADVTGAGDTVISTLAVACAAGASLADAAALANRAAGIVVGKFGPATVTMEELRQSTVDSR